MSSAAKDQLYLLSFSVSAYLTGGRCRCRGSRDAGSGGGAREPCPLPSHLPPITSTLLPSPSLPVAPSALIPGREQQVAASVSDAA